MKSLVFGPQPVWPGAAPNYKREVRKCLCILTNRHITSSTSQASSGRGGATNNCKCNAQNRLPTAKGAPNNLPDELRIVDVAVIPQRVPDRVVPSHCRGLVKRNGIAREAACARQTHRARAESVSRWRPPNRAQTLTTGMIST